MKPLRFENITGVTPDLEAVKAEYDAIAQRWDQGERKNALDQWDALLRRQATWGNLTSLRFQQNTRDPDAKAGRELLDKLTPELATFEMALKRKLLADPDRKGLEALVTRHAVDLWEADVKTFDPAIVPDLQEEAKLTAKYTELTASASFNFRGETLSLMGIRKFLEHPDRQTRYEAEKARWGFFADKREELDQLYDDLVRLRDGMARKLGFSNYLGLGYLRKRRTDYGPSDVAQWRDQVASDITPLVSKLMEQRAQAFGYNKMRFWDETIDDPKGNPKPAGDRAFITKQAHKLFGDLHPELGAFYKVMDEGNFMDLDLRPGKGGGGFCTSFPSEGVPYIFASFNGTKGDVKVFVHEIGHAFQNWMSRPLSIHLTRATSETAEIHSMGMEFLTLPGIDALMGPVDGERFRSLHVADSLYFLPYGVSIDHFQHLVYENPSASPEDRFAMWKEVEQRYMPWVDYGDIGHLNAGGRWQEKLHTYLYPLYYIDYTLAQAVALQLWALSQRDGKAAWTAYAGIAGRGGSATFTDLVTDAGLLSPFAGRAIEEVAAAVKKAVGL